MSDQISNNDKINPIHYKYWIFFLSMSLIILACVKWTDLPDFTTYLTNVATFVSLVLGLVAIIYSFVSNSSLSNSLGNISKVAEEITLTKQQIQNFSDISSQLSKKTSENAELIIESSTNVHQSVVSLKDVLTQLTAKTETLQDLVSTIPARLDHLQSSLESGSNISDVADQGPANPQSSESFAKFQSHFISSSSIIGICALYAMKLAYQRSKHLNFEDFCNKVGFPTSSQYVKAYIVASSSAQLASYDDVDNSSIEVKTISSIIIETDFNKLLNDEIIGRNLTDNEFVIGLIQKIESYFS